MRRTLFSTIELITLGEQCQAMRCELDRMKNKIDVYERILDNRCSKRVKYMDGEIEDQD